MAAHSQEVLELLRACRRGDVAGVLELVNEGAEVDVLVDDWSPLMLAAANDHNEVVFALLEARASVDLADTNGATSLYIASQNGRVVVATTLLEAGASVDLADIDGKTPLIIAAYNGHVDVVATLLTAGASVDLANNNGVTPLYIASQNGHVDVVTTLLEAGASVDVATKNGWTPLYIASQSGHIDVVIALLEAEPNADLATNAGTTPLHGAVRHRHVRVVEALLEAGASANLASDDGKTPLATAIEQGFTGIEDTLRCASAGINGYTRDGEPSIVAASRSGASTVLTSCLESDEEVCVKDLELAMWWAVACGRPECVKLLLSHEGAQRDLSSNICLAAHLGYLSVVEVLVEHDASLLDATEQLSGLTAVDYAVDGGHDDLVEWFRAHGCKSPRARSDTAFQSRTEDTSQNPLMAYEPTIPRAASVTLQNIGAVVGPADPTGISKAATGVPASQNSEVDDACMLLAFATLHSSVGSAEMNDSVTLPFVATAVERLVARLHALSNGFVFKHILPTGDLGEGAYGKVQRGNYFGREVAFKLRKNFDTV